MSSSVTWLTVADVCSQLNVSRDTFDKWIKAGKCPKHRRLPNGRLSFDSRDVSEWLDTLLVVA
jgi:excisionase family DNA binding protein